MQAKPKLGSGALQSCSEWIVFSLQLLFIEG